MLIQMLIKKMGIIKFKYSNAIIFNIYEKIYLQIISFEKIHLRGIMYHSEHISHDTYLDFFI